MHRISLDDTPVVKSSTTAAPIDETAQSEDNQISAKPQVHRLNLEETASMKKNSFKSFVILAVVAVLAGVGTGFGSYKLSASQQAASNPEEVSAQPSAASVKKGDVFGSSNTDAFKDSAMGYLEAGGLDGEGSHKLIRPGGISQTVYLTSSVTDLNELVGMDVKIWGETYKGQKAGWLMDVGRIEVLDTKGTKPTED